MLTWLSRLREADSPSEVCGRLAEEVRILRGCIDWLGRMERGESVVVNLRLDTDRPRSAPLKTNGCPFATAARPVNPLDLALKKARSFSPLGERNAVFFEGLTGRAVVAPASRPLPGAGEGLNLIW
jgi:hypothetical protein